MEAEVEELAARNLQRKATNLQLVIEFLRDNNVKMGAGGIITLKNNKTK